MGRLKTSLEIFKRSLSVIEKNKSLLLFPAIELVFIFLIILFFISPFVLTDTGHALTDPLHWRALGDQIKNLAENKEHISSVFGFTWFALTYLISMFSATFFSVAFYNEIIHAINGNGVSIARGIRAALSKIKLILIWSIFAGIVGLIIKTLEERLSFVGQWLMRLIGISWSVASIFVIPVIIREEKSPSPMKLLRTSALLVKRTWGETVIGFLGIGSVFLFGFIVSVFLFLIALFFVGVTVPTMLWVVITIILLYLISMLAYGYLCGVTRHVYCCALYVYASEGVVPGPFDEEMMNRAWKVKGVQKN